MEVVAIDVRELVRRCAQEVLKLSFEGLDALDKQRAYGNALIECVRRHFGQRRGCCLLTMCGEKGWRRKW